MVFMETISKVGISFWDIRFLFLRKGGSLLCKNVV